MKTKEVFHQLSSSIHQPISLIRIGDGENKILAWNTPHEFKEKSSWFQYAGVDLSEMIKKQLIWGIKESHILGLEHREGRVFRELLEKILAYYRIEPKMICPRDINKRLWRKGYLFHLLRGQRVILVGRLAREAAASLQKEGIVVVDYMGFEGFYDTDRVLEELRFSPPCQVILVAAGIPAVLLVPLIAKKYKIMTLDIGHVMDYLVNPSFQLQKERQDWFERSKTCCGIVVGNYLVKEASCNRYYILTNGKKFFVQSEPVLKSYGLEKKDFWKEIHPALLDMLPAKTLSFPDGSLMKSPQERRVYYIWHGVRHGIESRRAYEKNFHQAPILAVDEKDLTAIPRGPKVKKPHPGDASFHENG